MDPAVLRLEFLDLSTASEPEKRLIDRLLFGSDRDLRLPWVTEKHVDEGVELEGSEGPLEGEPELTPSGEWVHHRYDEPEVGGEAGLEQVAPQPRGQPFVYYPVQYYPHQTYAYPEMDQRAIMHRHMKKSDKKIEVPPPHQQQPPFQPQPVQLVMYSPMFPHHFLQTVPVYTSDYHHHSGYMGGEEHVAYPEDQSFAAPPPQEDIVPIPLQTKLDSPMPIQKEHEHVCQHAEVTVSAPKKKPIEDSVVNAVVATEPVMGGVIPSPQLVDSSLPPPPPVPVVFSSAPAVDSERTVTPPNYSNIARVDEPTPLTPTVSEIKESVQGNMESVGNTPLSLQQQQTYSDYPNLASASSVNSSAPAASASGSAKTYAQLFKQESKQRPLARVSPFDLSQSVAAPQDNSATVAADKVTPANFTNHHNDYKLSEDPYTVRLGESLKNYQLDHKAVSLTPRGLMNRSNWCYVNAVLQALIACPSFFNLIKALPIPQDPKQASKTPIIGAMVDLIQSFPPLSTSVRPKRRDKAGREEGSDLPTGSSFEPTGVYKVLDKVRGDSSFSVEGRQEDAEEFLSCLLNGLNDEMFEVVKLMGGVETELTNGDTGSETETEGWKIMGPKNKGAVTRRAVCGKTLVSDIFRGQLRSRVQRTGGEHTDNVQPFFTLQLDIEKVGSVKEALDLLVGKDAIDGMTCSKTHQEIEAYRQTTLEDLPLVLILHLKCFDYKPDGCTKIIKTVDFPIDLKIETKLMSSNKNKYSTKQRCYKLVAVVYHEGKEATKGHYVTDAYHVGLGIWIRYDDGNVKRVPEERVLKPVSPLVPYLLYYRRSDTMSHIKT